MQQVFFAHGFCKRQTANCYSQIEEQDDDNDVLSPQTIATNKNTINELSVKYQI